MALLALREEFVSTLVTDVVDGPDILRALLEYVDRVRKFFNGFEIYRPSMDNIDFDGAMVACTSLILRASRERSGESLRLVTAVELCQNK